MEQSLTLNILPVSSPQPVQNFTFYTADKEGRFRIHKHKLEGLLDGLVKEDDLDEGKYLYTDFKQHKDGITLVIDLREHIHFAAHYYRFLIQEYFKGIADAIRPNFTKEIEVWFKHEVQNSAAYTVYNEFTIKVQHGRITNGAELVLSYDGTTKVLNKSLKDLGSIDTTILNWVKSGNQLFKYEKMPIDHKQDLDKIHPVLSNPLKKHFGISPDTPDLTNRYPKYWHQLNCFCNDYLNTPDFQKLFTVHEGFLKVANDQIQMTLPGSNDLLFGLNKVGTEPKTDMRKKGPYKPTTATNVRFLFIYQEKDKLGPVKTLYNYFQFGLTAKDQQGNDYQAFPPIADYIKQPMLFDGNKGISFQSIGTAVAEVQRQIKTLEKQPGVQYIAIYITPVNRFVEDEEQKTVYFRIKEILLQEGITSQAIYRENIYKDAFKYYLPNIEIAILAKLGGIPWRLNRLKTDELIVGIGAFKSVSRKTRFVGSAFCFNNEGIFEGFDCFPADDTNMLAGSIRVAVIKFIAEHLKVKRLIIHFYKDISNREIQPILDTLHDLNINIPVVVVTINKTESKELLAFDTSNANLMPYSGTILKIGKCEYLLFNNTRYNAASKVTAKEYHFPIKISFYATQQTMLQDENTVTELIDQVYQFSRMYWKSVSQQNLPVTIKYSEMVAQIYPHFQNNTLSEFARKNLWFL